jgi:hypothetical protein
MNWATTFGDSVGVRKRGLILLWQRKKSPVHMSISLKVLFSEMAILGMTILEVTLLKET